MWLGLDFGTSSAKAVLLDDDGRVLARASESLATSAVGNRAEQDPVAYLTAARELVATLAPDPRRLRGIGLSGQTPSVVLVDEASEPVRPVLTWQDTRATEQAAALAERFGDPWPWVGTSLPWSASACPAKLAWIAEHEPASQERTRWVLQPKDFVGLALTGRPVSDPWSSKGLCHVGTRRPAVEVMRAAGWSEHTVPEIEDGWRSRGPLHDAGAGLLGLPGCTAQVAVGWSDALSGMLVTGAFDAPSAFVITGTSAIVGVSGRVLPDQAGGLYVIPSSCAPLGVVYGPTNASGDAIAWAARLLQVDPAGLVDLALSAAGADGADAGGPVFVPYLTGERAPLWRNDIRAILGDLDVAHDRADVALAVLRGVALNERVVLDAAESELPPSGAAPVHLGGHAGADQRWHRLRSAMLGRDLIAHTEPDPASRGAAALAMVAGGVAWSTATAALSSEVTTVRAREGDQGDSGRWAQRFAEFAAAAGNRPR